jgi:hypothetical protein
MSNGRPLAPGLFTPIDSQSEVTSAVPPGPSAAAAAAAAVLDATTVDATPVDTTMSQESTSTFVPSSSTHIPRDVLVGDKALLNYMAGFMTAQDRVALAATSVTTRSYMPTFHHFQADDFAGTGPVARDSPRLVYPVPLSLQPGARVLSIRVKCNWCDQGWGNRKGCLILRVRRDPASLSVPVTVAPGLASDAKEDDNDEKAFIATEYLNDKIGTAPHTDADIDVVLNRLPKGQAGTPDTPPYSGRDSDVIVDKFVPSTQLELWCFIGGDGGHRIKLRNIHIVVEVQDKS